MKTFASDVPGPGAAELILESMPNPVIMINNESTVLYINRSMEVILLSRILAVADAFDAMTLDRSYRKAYPLEKALEELVRNGRIQFDPAIVEIFIEMLKEYAQ